MKLTIWDHILLIVLIQQQAICHICVITGHIHFPTGHLTTGATIAQFIRCLSYKLQKRRNCLIPGTSKELFCCPRPTQSPVQWIRKKTHWTTFLLHPASCKMDNGSFSGVKCGWDVLLTIHPLLVLRSWKSGAIPLPTLWATPGLWQDHFTFYVCVYTIGTGSFPGVKCGWGVLLTIDPLLVLRSWKSGAIPLPTLWATPGLWRDHFTFYVCVCVCVCIQLVLGLSRG